MMSLARSFFAQGAKHVISTHWPVADRASAEFMRYFYEALARKGIDNAASALYSAQKRLSRHPRYKDPFYWGGYMSMSAR